jgi:hypothetical protein
LGESQGWTRREEHEALSEGGAAVVHGPKEERENLDEKLVAETMRHRGCARGLAWWSLSDACGERPIFCNRLAD